MCWKLHCVWKPNIQWFLKSRFKVVMTRQCQDVILLPFAHSVVCQGGHFWSSEKIRTQNISCYFKISWVFSGVMLQPSSLAAVCLQASINSKNAGKQPVLLKGSYSFTLVTRGLVAVHFGSAHESKGSKLIPRNVSLHFHKMWVEILASHD